MEIPEKLKQAGLKTTAPRLVVLNVFREHERRHLTADDIHRWTTKRGETLALATIYRVLTQLTEVGMLRRTALEWPSAHHELPQDPHHDHLVCHGCGRVDEFTDSVVQESLRKIAAAKGYAVVRCELTLHGYCSKCRSRRGRGG